MTTEEIMELADRYALHHTVNYKTSSLTRNSLQSAIEALVRDVGTCTWAQPDVWDMPGVYSTSCGEMWSFTEGGVEDNKLNFCPHCGGRAIAAQEVKNG